MGGVGCVNHEARGCLGGGRGLESGMDRRRDHGDGYVYGGCVCTLVLCVGVCLCVYGGVCVWLVGFRG